MKKKFLLYVVVIVTCLFLGFTVYYLARNDENISLNIDNEQTTYINVNETIAWPIIWTKPYKETTLSVVISNESVLEYKEDTKVFKGISGGYTNVTITPSNKNFGPFVFDVYVGDGNQGSPYIIKTAESLAKIGVEYEYPANKYYALANDIDIKTINNGKWSPLPEFSGNFNGNGHTIYNLDIADSTYGGLFSKVANEGKVENVKFERVAINGSFDYVGVVAGQNKGFIGKVNVVSGSITNNKDAGVTGGIVGANLYDLSPAYINMCSANINAKVSSTFGGLVGLNKSSVILNSSAIIGTVEGTNADAYVGGLVGINQSTYNATDVVYYPSAIAKCYVVFNETTGMMTAGAVLGENSEDNNGNQLFTNKYEDIIYSVGDGIADYAIAKGDELLDSKASITLKSKNDMLLVDTFTNFNFETVWSIASNDYPRINLGGSYETIIIRGIGEEFNYSNDELQNFLLNELKNLSGNTSTIYVTQDTEIDLQGAEWTTIAKNPEQPITASIIVEDGVKCEIKNFKLTGDNTSFFGHISGNTIIDGITFTNVIIDNTTESNASVVATTLTNGATLQNITVNNANIKSNAEYTSAICANNQANIINTTASNIAMTVYAKSGVLKNIGGLVALNSGLVSKSNINTFELEINTTQSSGNFNIGGIAGLTETTISECGVNVFTLQTTNNGSMNVGGVVGYALTKNGDVNQPISINKCYAKATLNLGVSNTNSYLGGVVGSIANGVSITNSAYKSGNLRGYMVAGIVALNNGTVSTSYSEGGLKGTYVGGITVSCLGNILNCYTLSTLTGESKSSIVAGVTVTMGPNCNIDKIFSSARFEGSGDHFAETQSVFRLSTVGKWIRSVKGDVNFGSISNLVIINYGEATVQTSSIFGGKSGWIDATEEDCRGKDGYAVLKEKAHFDSSVWNFENNGSYPTLKDAVVVD